MKISGVPAQTVQVITESSENTAETTQTGLAATVESPEQRNVSPSRRRQQQSPRKAATRNRATQQNLMAVAQNNQNQVRRDV